MAEHMSHDHGLPDREERDYDKYDSVAGHGNAWGRADRSDAYPPRIPSSETADTAGDSDEVAVPDTVAEIADDPERVVNLTLVEDDSKVPDWRLDEATKAIGRRGIAAARASLRSARATHLDDKSTRRPQPAPTPKAQ